jgi:hypothetical protein
MKRTDGTGGNSQDFSNFFCPDINHLIGGDLTENFFGSLSFKIKMCDSKTEKSHNITCATAEERRIRYKNKFFVGKVTHNHIIDPSDFANPITQTFDYTTQRLELDFLKQTFISFSINHLRTDSGILSEDFKEKVFLQIDSEIMDFERRGDDNIISESHIMISRNSNKYVRTYIKLQQVFAIVGGFTSISMKILATIYSFYINAVYYQFIYESFMDIETLVSRKSKKKLHAIMNDKERNFKSEINPGKFLNYQETKSLDFDSVKRKSYIKKFKFKFGQTIIDSIFRTARPAQGLKNFNEENIRVLIKKEISDKFDLLNYFKLTDEFSVLKKIVLNPEQNFILSKKRKTHFEDLVSKNNSFLNEKEMLSYIKNKLETQTMSSTDELLYSYLDWSTKLKIEKSSYIV